jgi:hypothetical protein
MNALLRLYPRAWRERYLAEVTALLEERPPSLGDRLDLLRGAADAWLHPQVAGNSAPSPEREPIMRPIGIAVLTIVGGVLWAAGGIVQHSGSYDPITGSKESAGVMVVIAAMLVTSLAAVVRAWGGPPTSTGLRRSAVFMLVLSLLMVLPWPILVVGFYGHVGGTMAFGALLSAAGLRSGAFLVIAAIVALFFNTESSLALATVPIGVAWIVVGVQGAFRRPVTPHPALP